ncbi:unnamed protein product [Boreogadus saida]
MQGRTRTAEPENRTAGPRREQHLVGSTLRSTGGETRPETRASFARPACVDPRSAQLALQRLLVPRCAARVASASPQRALSELQKRRLASGAGGSREARFGSSTGADVCRPLGR